MKGGPSCHNCGSGGLRTFPRFRSLPLVSSDCRPFPPSGELAMCPACGLLQKAILPSLLKKIHGTYGAYPQGGGAEQVIMSGKAGASTARSAVMLDRLNRWKRLPAEGSMLDVGCSNGGLLRSFHRLRPSWSMSGNDLNLKVRKTVESLPGRPTFIPGPVGSLRGSYDLITLVHSFEHIKGPGAVLTELAGVLSPRGRIVIQGPTFLKNPFDLVVADHYNHFTPTTLDRIVRGAGLSVLTTSTAWIDKELSVVAGRSADGAAGGAATREEAAADARDIERRLRWLEQVQRAAAGLAKKKTVGVFGAAIGATWLLSAAPEASFFVDEDPSRVGRRFLDRPILRPDQVPRGAAVFMPLLPRIAAKIRRRLRLDPAVFHLPPALPWADGAP